MRLDHSACVNITILIMTCSNTVARFWINSFMVVGFLHANNCIEMVYSSSPLIYYAACFGCKSVSMKHCTHFNTNKYMKYIFSFSIKFWQEILMLNLTEDIQTEA